MHSPYSNKLDGEFRLHDQAIVNLNNREQPYCIARVIGFPSDGEKPTVEVHLSLAKRSFRIAEGEQHRTHLAGKVYVITADTVFYNRAKLSFTTEAPQDVVFRRLVPRPPVEGGSYNS